MVKAKLIAEALKLDYITDGEQDFTIKRSVYRYNTYTIGQQKYLFGCSSSLAVMMESKETPYTSSRSINNMCHIDTLGNLVNYKYYSSAKVPDYARKSYLGIVCYSKYGAITKAPDMTSVVTPKLDKFFPDMGVIDQNNSMSNNLGINRYPTNKLIIVGDSRTNNMSQWVTTTVSTEFIAKNGKGYLWLTEEGIDEVNKIKNPGDAIILWLGVNDYFSKDLGGDTILSYANKINNLVINEWSDCNVFVAEVGYVDSQLIIDYYGQTSRANANALETGNHLNGIKDFNDYLKWLLSDKVTWIPTNDIIGINANDSECTPEDLWLVRENGKVDGLHYGKVKSIEIYQYFVKMAMNY